MGINELDCRARMNHDHPSSSILRFKSNIGCDPSTMLTIVQPTPSPHAKHQIGDVLSIWDHKFTFTAEHLTWDRYTQLKHSYDRLGEDCLNILEALEDPAGAPQGDLYSRLAHNHASDPKLTQLWDQLTNPPAWLDWDQIRRGQDVYKRYGYATASGLTYSSLLGGTGSSGQIAETLGRTGGFSIKSIRHRLLETAQWTLQITESPAGLRAGGDGFVATVRVRLLHAKVRRRILQLAAAEPTYYSVARYGVPINDADAIATIVAFCPLLIWLALPRQGIRLREQEIEDYVAFWRFVSVLMGSPADEFASAAQAKRIMEAILLYEDGPTETSKTLARNVIRAWENQAPQFASRSLLEAEARWLNGDTLSDAIGLARPTRFYWALTAGKMLWQAAYYNVVRAVPRLDAWNIRSSRKVIWKAVIGAKYGLRQPTTFQFKHLPNVNRTGPDEVDTKELRGPFLQSADAGALYTLIFTSVIFVGFLWVSLHVTRGVLFSILV